MTLYEECIEALGDNLVIYSEEDSINIFNKFENSFPMYYIADSILSRIDWNKIYLKYTIKHNLEELLTKIEKHYKENDFEVYILWNEANLPVLKTTLKKVLLNIDDVTAVGFDTWIFCESNNYVIEFFHDGEIVLGLNN